MAGLQYIYIYIYIHIRVYVREGGEIADVVSRNKEIVDTAPIVLPDGVRVTNFSLL